MSSAARGCAYMIEMIKWGYSTLYQQHEEKHTTHFTTHLHDQCHNMAKSFSQSKQPYRVAHSDPRPRKGVYTQHLVRQSRLSKYTIQKRCTVRQTFCGSRPRSISSWEAQLRGVAWQNRKMRRSPANVTGWQSAWMKLRYVWLPTYYPNHKNSHRYRIRL